MDVNAFERQIERRHAALILWTLGGEPVDPTALFVSDNRVLDLDNSETAGDLMRAMVDTGNGQVTVLADNIEWTIREAYGSDELDDYEIFDLLNAAGLPGPFGPITIVDLGPATQAAAVTDVKAAYRQAAALYKRTKDIADWLAKPVYEAVGQEAISYSEGSSMIDELEEGITDSAFCALVRAENRLLEWARAKVKAEGGELFANNELTVEQVFSAAARCYSVRVKVLRLALRLE